MAACILGLAFDAITGLVILLFEFVNDEKGKMVKIKMLTTAGLKSRFIIDSFQVDAGLL